MAGWCVICIYIFFLLLFSILCVMAVTVRLALFFFLVSAVLYCTVCSFNPRAGIVLDSRWILHDVLEVKLSICLLVVAWL